MLEYGIQMQQLESRVPIQHYAFQLLPMPVFPL